MSYNINASADNCYEGTTCLINKFNIHDEAKLNKIESAITFAKSSLLENTMLSEKFDFDHYKSIHKFLFDEIYDWAGQIRTINLSKKGTNFVSYNEIEKIGNICFSKIAKENYFKDYDFDSFVVRITDFYCDTNILHPFREGNGRTQRIFLTQLIRSSGHNINFSEIDKDELMMFTIQSANGVKDNLYSLFYNSIN